MCPEGAYLFLYLLLLLRYVYCFLLSTFQRRRLFKSLFYTVTLLHMLLSLIHISGGCLSNVLSYISTSLCLFLSLITVLGRRLFISLSSSVTPLGLSPLLEKF